MLAVCCSNSSCSRLTRAVKRARYAGHLPRACVQRRISRRFLAAFQNVRVLGFALAVSIAASLSLRRSSYAAVLPISVFKRVIILLRAVRLLDIWRIFTYWNQYGWRLWDFSRTGEFCLGITARAVRGISVRDQCWEAQLPCHSWVPTLVFKVSVRQTVERSPVELQICCMV